MMKFFNRFAKDESGATAIEYGLIIALMATLIVAAVGGLGGTLKGAFTAVGNKLDAASTPAA